MSLYTVIFFAALLVIFIWAGRHLDHLDDLCPENMHGVVEISTTRMISVR